MLVLFYGTLQNIHLKDRVITDRCPKECQRFEKQPQKEVKNIKGRAKPKEGMTLGSTKVQMLTQALQLFMSLHLSHVFVPHTMSKV